MRYTVDSDTAKPSLSVIQAETWRLARSGNSRATASMRRSSLGVIWFQGLPLTARGRPWRHR